MRVISGLLDLVYALSQPAKSSPQPQRNTDFKRASVGKLGKYSPASTL